jgi:hypothetical protein
VFRLFTARDEQVCAAIIVELGFSKKQKAERLKIITLENTTFHNKIPRRHGDLTPGYVEP